ncbi:MAG: hypothetical protein AAFV53_01475 [Myxococcota bacterium]
MADEQDPKPSSPRPQGLVQMVTPLQSLNEQVGHHVLQALQQPNSVALLSTIVPGVGQDRVVSVPLTPQQFQAVQGLLMQLMSPQQLPPMMRRAIGFGRVDGEE